ncbi:MAG TPA: polysaccharide lyase family protein [Phycisphaerae bacterium]|nr:polysaccharide lyase family protein [Phycisphaerae bacterium]
MPVVISRMLLIVALLVVAAPAAGEAKPVFCIGTPDGRAAEFGLTQQKWPEYLKVFPKPVVYTVGSSKPADWPYVQPSNRDVWGGSRAHTFTIRFSLPAQPTEPLFLHLGTLAVHEPGTLTVSLNARALPARPAGQEAGGSLVSDPLGGGGSAACQSFRLEPASFRQGENTIAMELQGGSFIIYDYVLLTPAAAPPAVQAAKPAKPAKAAKGKRAAAPDDAGGKLREAFLAPDGPMAGVDEIVFAVRGIVHEHWYANIGYISTDRNRAMYGKNGRLCKLNLRTGKVTDLVNDPDGSVRDPAVHYDGKRIVFAWRKGGTEQYHLYLIHSDGTGLRQITDGKFDDYEPCWLPDDELVFVSTRARRWVQCWLTQVGNIYRCDLAGRNMRPLSANLEHDNTPWLLSDGRILYMRWEYVDRSQVDYHHLWTMYGDGAVQNVFFGNNWGGGVYIDAKPIPNSEKVVLIHSPGHGQAEHQGWLATLDVARGSDDRDSLRNLTREAHYRDPWAFSEECFLAARNHQLVLADADGRTDVLFELAEAGKNVWVHEPRPLIRRPRERNISSHVDLSKADGTFFLENVYFGRNTAGIKPGEIKKLLIVESLPKPVNFTGGMDPLSYSGTFSLERVLGTVPVEADGSAHFTAPALRSLFFVALDERGRSVKRMQSFTGVQPGETVGCVGCHEQRTQARSAVSGEPVQAARRAPSPITPFAGVPDLPDFPRDVQPILDRHCLKCHDVDKRSGGVLLTGDRGPMFSHSYYTLTIRRQLADGRNYARNNYPPRALGSGGSALMDKIDNHHNKVALSPAERQTVLLWLEIGAPYPGTYAALGTGSIGGYEHNSQHLHNDAKWPTTLVAQPVYARRCNSCHAGKTAIPHTLSDEIGLSFWRPDMNDPRLPHARHIVFNLTRPDKSLILLAPLARSAGGYGLCKPADAKDADAAKADDKKPDSTVFASRDDADYKLLLTMVQAGKARLDEIKRFDMPGFRPRPEYVREMVRYGLLPETFDLAKDPIDVYAMDRKYWQSLWYRPPGS